MRSRNPGAERQGEGPALPRLFSVGLQKGLREKPGSKVGEAFFSGSCLEENGQHYRKGTGASLTFPL